MVIHQIIMEQAHVCGWHEKPGEKQPTSHVTLEYDTIWKYGSRSKAIVQAQSWQSALHATRYVHRPKHTHCLSVT